MAEFFSPDVISTLGAILTLLGGGVAGWFGRTIQQGRAQADASTTGPREPNDGLHFPPAQPLPLPSYQPAQSPPSPSQREQIRHRLLHAFIQVITSLPLEATLKGLLLKEALLLIDRVLSPDVAFAADPGVPGATKDSSRK